ncbi:glycosyltransferase family 2 protein [Segetibacter sp. 3557_3]|uniref:glycosyltransferase family 2 protein n=1 Tax=Segetibacter sp. 3557_3 TaxID=2547429 RepID=UPI001058D5C2|nr:glycosyltransferase family 2 protein [Segetibacter sp. 3557_3]TDH24635.1 glycosyltransferase family 2 protein [Segetibacter sp. 3557_3]
MTSFPQYSNTKKIIVLTPVKNEAWILDRFLQVCSRFADHILIADQKSTDGSIELYSKYSKVTLLINNDPDYDEATRQMLLITTARQQFGIGNILLAIDADELLAANAIYTSDWERMLRAQPGTILYFEKPTLYKSTNNVIRYDGGGWPLGYVDDGAIHTPAEIHSTRIPTPNYATKLYLDEIKFIHYALVRLDAQASKQRMYSMVENIKGTKSLRLRIKAYNSSLDFTNEGDRHETPNTSWFIGWEKEGIDMHTIPTSAYYWYDYEGLKLFRKYGVKRFALDDIWNFDWEGLRLAAIKENYPFTPEAPIKNPRPLTRKLIAFILTNINQVLSACKKLRQLR